MGIWTYVKRGFGYGLGGRIGWELGGVIWALLRWLIVGLLAALGLPALL